MFYKTHWKQIGNQMEKKNLYTTLWDVKLEEGIFHGDTITILLFEGFLHVNEIDLFSKCQNFLHKLDLSLAPI